MHSHVSSEMDNLLEIGSTNLAVERTLLKQQWKLKHGVTRTKIITKISLNNHHFVYF